MSISKCCECNAKAAVFVGGKFYCSFCSPLGKPIVPDKEIELDMAHPDWKPKCETKKKEGFWDKLARWFNSSDCGCM